MTPRFIRTHVSRSAPLRIAARVALALPLAGAALWGPGLAQAEGGERCAVGDVAWSSAERLTCRVDPLRRPESTPDLDALAREQPVANGSSRITPGTAVSAPAIVRAPEPSAFERARALAADGELDAALGLLDETAAAFPRLADRVALLRAELLIDAARYPEAAEALRTARQSVDSAVRVEAEIAEVRVRILSDDPRADGALRALMGRYQELPGEAQLRLLLGESQLRRDRRTQAAETFRVLDLHFPGSPAAEAGLAHLTALREAGVRVRRQLTTERVDRAERMVSLGQHERARAELAALGEVRLSRALRSRVHLAAAQLARLEGRWSDALTHQQQGIRQSPPVSAEETEERAERAADLMTAALSRDVEIATRRVEHMVGRRAYAQLSNAQLVQVIEVAARAGLAEPVRSATHALSTRDIAADARMNAALEAMGLADDTDLLRMFEPLANTRSQRGTQAAYYRARALERLGRLDEARAAYGELKTHDRTPQRYYAMWADVRVRALQPAPASDSRRLDPAATRSVGEGTRGAPVDIAPGSLHLNVDLNLVAERLLPLAAEHGDAFPSLPRAYDLLRLGEPNTATHELYEAFLQWRDARGTALRRTGLEGVARGGDRRRSAVSFTARQERRGLAPEERLELAEISSALGDHGIAVGMVGWSEVGARPRAHAHLVEEAALRHGLDPNLLFAIMRVESVYQQGIISYAGAIGLAQIMPRTGRLIAEARGMTDFDTGDLVDPAVNLDFAAWYLASLIERFDGHLPLAIASYNGGPHNVRRWLRAHGPGQPIDAFLEFIPFEQTHRYVRRVLTHYQAYRAQAGLPPEVLSMALPSGDDHAIAF
ncbi:MAG: transglycosylase SLT domain-containing protein [Polyangiales bacterium]|nr:transglycosylase SLT domain-containing protein [Myxococcales bacterium]